MESTGNKIAELRKANNLTQAELGEKLNVSAQAVSKWEKDLSEPDISTLNKLCEIFDVTLDEIAGKEKEPTIVVKSEPVHAPRQVVATCTKCHESLYSRNEYSVRDDGHGATIVCNNCLKKEEISKIEYERDDAIKMFKWGIAIGAPVSVALLLVCILCNPLSLAIGARIGIGIACWYCSFTFITQLFYSETVQDIMDFFRKTFNLPMIIWEFSLDGFIRMLLIKWFLGILAWTLSALIFAAGAVITAAISAFTFPFTLPAYVNERKEEKKKINALAKSIKLNFVAK